MDSRLVPANETVGWKGAEPKCNAPNLVDGAVMTVKDSCATIFSSLFHVNGNRSRGFSMRWAPAPERDF